MLGETWMYQTKWGKGIAIACDIIILLVLMSGPVLMIRTHNAEASVPSEINEISLMEPYMLSGDALWNLHLIEMRLDELEELIKRLQEERKLDLQEVPNE